MYDELVEQLRGYASWIQLPHAQRMKLMLEAADAIEELAAFKAQITDGHFTA